MAQFKDIFVGLLQKNNTSAYNISKTTGISQGLLSDYKSGRSLPTVKNLIKLSEYFNVSIDYLVGNPNLPALSDKLADSSLILSPDQRELLNIWEKLDPIKQAEFKDELRIVLGRTDNPEVNR